jgi:hypothetical protein
MSESDLQTLCNQWLTSKGYGWYHREKGRSNKQSAHSKGLPDLIIWKDGLILFIELKDKGKKQNKGQIEWQEKQTAGCDYYVCDDIVNIYFGNIKK